ncbi:MAG: MliC family protein [Lysobacteraceae bacterium]|uniref:MliC family protein n=1 Tax=Denitratimonas sp. CY0512 TaxID=3131940 RepID=UPI001694330F|nr:lysozyme inhibitor [Gammaproteobacteria bacterium]
MKPVLAAWLIVLLAGACSAVPTTPDFHDVDFSCANGESVSVRFFLGQERAVLSRRGQGIELAQQRSGSGFIYSNGPNTIRGKGDALTIEIGRMVPIECNASPAQR